MEVTRGAVELQLPNKKSKALTLTLNLPPGVDAGAAHDLAVLLSPAASGRMEHGMLPAVASALAAAGVPTLRYECPGPHFDHRCEVAAALLRAVAAGDSAGGDKVLGLGRVSRWVAAGSSMGARVSCRLTSDGLACSVALLSYPLVSNKGESRLPLLTALPQGTPALLVHGGRDEFAPPSPWQAALHALQGRAPAPQVLELADADHGLHVRGGAAANAEATTQVLDTLTAFVLAQRQMAAGSGGAGGVSKRPQGGDDDAPQRKRGKQQQ